MLDLGLLPVLPPEPVSYCAFVSNLGVELTAPQEALARVAFDGAEPRDVPRASELFGGALTIPVTCRRTVNITCGRGSGKTYVFGALRLLWGALTRDLSSLAPGQIAAAVIVAPRIGTAREGLRYVLGAIESDPDIARCIESQSVDRIVLRRPDGKRVSIECLPASSAGAALRGRSYTDVLFDEAAFFRDEAYAVNDMVLYRAVKPRMLPGAQIIIASTTWVKAGLLYEKHRDNYGHPVDALAAIAPTILMREGDATVAAVVAEEYAKDPANAACEFGCEFLGTGTNAMFDAAAIDASVQDYGLGELAAPGVFVSFGGDLGFRRDSSALVGIHRTGAVTLPTTRYKVAELHELRPSAGVALKPSETIEAFAQVIKRQRASYFVGDRHYRETAVEHLAKSGIAFVDAPTTPAEAFVRARELLHDGRCILPNEPRFLRQLRETTMTPQSGGGLSVTLPRWKMGGHGDIVSAWVLALHNAGGESVPLPAMSEADRIEAEEDAAYEASKGKPWWMKR